MPKYRGTHRITVESTRSDWPQRVVVRVRGGAPIVLPGRAGASEVVDAAEWDLELEHEIDGTWHANVRAVVCRWQERSGVHCQQIRSTDRDRPGAAGNSLVLRIERGGPRPPAAGPAREELRRAATESRASSGGAPRATAPATYSGSGLGGDAPAPTRTLTSAPGWSAAG